MRAGDKPRASGKAAAVRRVLAAAAALSAALAVPATAQNAAGAPAGQPMSQRLAVCAACHGPGGNSQVPNSPSLAAQPKVFLEHQLIVIREGLRVIPAMTGMLDGMSDKEITAVAEYFASQPLKPQPGERNEAQFERGRTIAARMHCASCHLAGYEGRDQMPRLAGQREDYLVHSMRDFKGGAAGRDTIMASALYGTSDQDIRDLAHYLAHLK